MPTCRPRAPPQAARHAGIVLAGHLATARHTDSEHTWNRRSSHETQKWITTLTLAAAAVGIAGAAQAQQFFRIGTGGTAGTYYPVGGIIANAVSQPGKLIATAVASNGSVANINGILGGSFEAGFTQSDVAFWAYSGTGTFDGKPKAQDLRLIATLYPESIHLVARKGSGIKSVADLKGKRVSMDEPGSGTLVDVRLILGAYGMTDKDIKAEYLKPNQAGDKLRTAAWTRSSSAAPAGAIAELASSGAGIEIVSLVGPEIDAARQAGVLHARHHRRQHLPERGRGQDHLGQRADGELDQGAGGRGL